MTNPIDNLRDTTPMPPTVDVMPQPPQPPPQPPQSPPLPSVVQPLTAEEVGDVGGLGETSADIVKGITAPGAALRQQSAQEQTLLNQQGVDAATQESVHPFLYSPPDFDQLAEELRSSATRYGHRIQQQQAVQQQQIATEQFAAEALKALQEVDQGTQSSTGNGFQWVTDWLGKTFTTDGNRQYIRTIDYDKTSGEYRGNFPASVMYGLGLLQNSAVGAALDVRNLGNQAYNMVPQWLRGNVDKAVNVAGMFGGMTGSYGKAVADWVKAPNRLNDGKSNFVEAIRGAQYSFTDDVNTGVGIKQSQGFRVGAAPGKGWGFDVNPSALAGFGLDVLVGSKVDDIASSGIRLLRGVSKTAPTVSKAVQQTASVVASAPPVSPTQLTLPFLPQMPKPKPRPVAQTVASKKAAQQLRKANAAELGIQRRAANQPAKGVQLTIPNVSPLVEAVSPMRPKGKLYNGTTAELRPGVNAQQLTLDLPPQKSKPAQTALLEAVPYKYAAIRKLSELPATEEGIAKVVALRSTSDAQVPQFRKELRRLETDMRNRMAADVKPPTVTQQELQLSGQPLGDLETKLQPLPNLSAALPTLDVPLPALQSRNVGELPDIQPKNVGELPALASTNVGELPALPTYGVPMADLRKPIPIELNEVPLPSLRHKDVGVLRLGTDVREFAVKLKPDEQARQLSLPLNVKRNAPPTKVPVIPQQKRYATSRQLYLNLKSPAVSRVQLSTNRSELAEAVNQLVQDSPHLRVVGESGDVSRTTITTQAEASKLIDNAVPSGASETETEAVKLALEAVDVSDSAVGDILDAIDSRMQAKAVDDIPSITARALDDLPAVIADTPEAQALANVVNVNLKSQVLNRVAAAAEQAAIAARETLNDTADIGRQFTTETVERMRTPLSKRYTFPLEDVGGKYYHGTRVEGLRLDVTDPIAGAARSELGVGHYLTVKKPLAVTAANATSAANLPDVDGRVFGQPSVLKANVGGRFLNANSRDKAVYDMATEVGKSFPELRGQFSRFDSIVDVYDKAAKALDEPTALEFQRHMARAFVEQGVDGIRTANTVAVYNPRVISQLNGNVVPNVGGIVAAKRSRTALELSAVDETGSEFSRAAHADALVSDTAQTVEELVPLVDDHAAHVAEVVDRSGLWDDLERLEQQQDSLDFVRSSIAELRERFARPGITQKEMLELVDEIDQLQRIVDEPYTVDAGDFLNAYTDNRALLDTLDETSDEYVKLAAKLEKELPAMRIASDIEALSEAALDLPPAQMKTAMETIQRKQQQLIDLIGRSPCNL